MTREAEFDLKEPEEAELVTCVNCGMVTKPEKCSRCGKNPSEQIEALSENTVVQGIDIEQLISKYMMKSTRFLIIAPFFRKINNVQQDSGELTPVKQWSLYEAKIDPNGSSYIIYDADGYVHPKRNELVITPETDPQVIQNVIKDSPKHVNEKIFKILAEWNIKPSKSPNDNVLASSKIFVRPVPRIGDIHVLKSMDWESFLENLLAYKCEKDEIMKLVNKAHLLRGQVMQLNPHSILATNSGTGKSEFYEITGIRFDRVNSRQFLGYAKSPNDVFVGTVADQELPIAIDQVESMGDQEILNYMFTAMEQGYANVGLGATSFSVDTKSSFIVLANIQSDYNNFRNLMSHICMNIPALGRRMGLILYRNDLRKITSFSKDLSKWKKMFQLFRGVEEYALPELRKIYHDDKVWSWIHDPIDKYKHRVRDIASSVKDEKLRTFFIEHGDGAQHRVKGAALNAAVVDYLLKIALRNYQITDILTTAAEYVFRYSNLNLESITTIAGIWEKEKEIIAREVYDNILPIYLQEVVSALTFYKNVYRLQNETPPLEFPLEVLGENYHCLHYKYFSKAVSNIHQSRSMRYNDYLTRHFGFELFRHEDGREWIRLTS